MNSFETLRGRIVARTTSSGFQSLWDAPTALCKHPNGMGGVPSMVSVQEPRCNREQMQVEPQASNSYLEEAGAWPVLSLFSGAGGFDLGFKQAGFKPRLAVDIDPAAVETYRWNEPDTHVALLDIAETNPDELVKLWTSINGDKGPVGIIGGPPCQAFSVSNVYQRRGDPRRKLLVNYASVIQAFTSCFGLDFFVFENVPGLTQKRHHRRYLEFKRLCRKAGYSVREKVVDAGSFGIPQNRKRIIVIGINRERFPGLLLDPPEGAKQPTTARVALQGLPEPAFCRRGLDETEVPHHPNPRCHGSKVNKVY